MSIFEAGMMICFGSSWPFQVAKTYKTKDVKGKSIFFLWLIQTGYVLGMIHKVLYNFDTVFYLYLLNFTLVAADMTLYYIYKNRDNAMLKNQTVELMNSKRNTSNLSHKDDILQNV